MKLHSVRDVYFSAHSGGAVNRIRGACFGKRSSTLCPWNDMVVVVVGACLHYLTNGAHSTFGGVFRVHGAAIDRNTTVCPRSLGKPERKHLAECLGPSETGWIDKNTFVRTT